METLFQICLSNAMVAGTWAAGAAAAGAAARWLAPVHGLWVLVLVKLVTPVAPAAVSGRAWPWSPAAPAARTIGRLSEPLVRWCSPRAGCLLLGGRPRSREGEFGELACSTPTPGAGRSSRRSGSRELADGGGAALGRPVCAAPPRGPPARRAGAWLAAWLLVPATGWLGIRAWLGVAACVAGRVASRLHRFRRLLAWAAPAPDAVQARARELAARRRRSAARRRSGGRSALISPTSGDGRGPGSLSPRPCGTGWTTISGRPCWSTSWPTSLAATTGSGSSSWSPPAAPGGNPLVGGPGARWPGRGCRRDAWVNSVSSLAGADYALAIVETLDFLAGEPAALEPMGGTGLTSCARAAGAARAHPRRGDGPPALADGGARPGGPVGGGDGRGLGLPASHRFRAMDLGNLGGGVHHPFAAQQSRRGHRPVGRRRLDHPGARRPMADEYLPDGARPPDRPGHRRPLAPWSVRTTTTTACSAGPSTTRGRWSSASSGGSARCPAEDINRAFHRRPPGRRAGSLGVPHPVAINDAGLIAVDGRRRIGGPTRLLAASTAPDRCWRTASPSSSVRAG